MRTKKERGQFQLHAVFVAVLLAGVCGRERNDRGGEEGLGEKEGSVNNKIVVF